MTKKINKKGKDKPKLKYKVSKASPEVQARALDRAYDILFEEILKMIEEKKNISK